MGLCGGGISATIDPAVTLRNTHCLKKIREDCEKAHNKKKLLLLGAGESGKSTVFKQMRIINASGYSSGELRQFRWIIHRNMIDGMRTLVEAAQEWGLELTESNEDVADAMLLYQGENVNPEMGESFASLWADPAIQQCFARRAEFQLGDGVQYFFDNLPRVAGIEYLPTVEDILHARVRTSGVVSRDFMINNQAFQMYDVGGQRSERRNWLPLFDNVTAIVFVAAISEYNQVVAEDRSKNRMQEALELFEQIANSKHFEGIDIILVLNKKDLFEQKIRTVDPVTWFPDYKGGCDFIKAEAYFKAQFEKRINDKKKMLYTYTTCATDTSSMQVVFTAVESMFLTQAFDSVMLGA